MLWLCFSSHRLFLRSVGRTASASSLFRVGEEWHLFVVEDGRARERKVGVGQRNATQAQIVDGIKAGETVVRFPGNDLSDGVRVAARSGRT